MQKNSTQIITNELPLVSVLIPLYNVENFLTQCLDSIVNQTYKNLEIIIVNDGSTDNSLSIAEEYSKEYSYVKVYSQENSGAPIARNKAFTLSKGEYIQYIDADDCLDINKIEVQVQELMTEGRNVLSFGPCHYFNHNINNVLTRELKLYSQEYSLPCDFLYYMWFNAEALPPLSYLCHRSLIEKSGEWEQSLLKNQDGEFFARVIISSSKVLFIPDSISYYRMDSPNSLSKGLSKRSLLSLIKSIEMYAEHSKKCKKDFTEALKTVYTRVIMQLYSHDPALAREVTLKKEQLGITGFRYPTRSKTYDILFLVLGIRITSFFHNRFVKIRDLIMSLKNKEDEH